jgi:hypothetical protein
MIGKGRLRAEKVAYQDGIGCCVWYPYTDDDGNEQSGLCFDFSASDIDDFIALLQQLRELEPDIYTE